MPRSTRTSTAAQDRDTLPRGYAADPEISGYSTDRLKKLMRLLRKAYPHVECALDHQNAFELLAATILSAQCTDERVNQVTPALFAAFPDPAALAAAPPKQVEQLIHSTGFYRAKAKNLIGMARGLVDRHAGHVPQSQDALVLLPGVGRKTANVVLGVWFGEPSGVVVDTHVKRISRLLGLTQQTDPVKIERDLGYQLPRREWIDFSHRLIHHGRQICIARRPRCPQCPLLSVCERVGLDG